MIRKIIVKKDVAHLLTKVSKKEKWYFRCLTRTDRNIDVVAEIHDAGIKYMNDKNIKFSEDEKED